MLAKTQIYSKKYWNWLLATSKTVSAYVLNRVVNMSLSLIITLSWQTSLSFRNQSIDLLSKSMNWFLYDKDLRHERDEGKLKFFLVVVFFSQIWQQIFFIEHFRLLSVYLVLLFFKNSVFIKPYRGDLFVDPAHLRSLFLSYRSSRQEVLCKKDVHIAKFIGKHPCWSLFFNVVAERASSPLHSSCLYREV